MVPEKVLVLILRHVVTIVRNPEHLAVGVVLLLPTMVARGFSELWHLIFHVLTLIKVVYLVIELILHV